MAQSHTILVVDDEPALRDIIAAVLSEPGHTVLTASDGYEALRILAERPVNLLITDIVMPGLSGFQLARQAKLMRRSLHVIYISAHQRDDKKAAGPTYGLLIHKPFRARDLVRQVNRELGAAPEDV